MPDDGLMHLDNLDFAECPVCGGGKFNVQYLDTRLAYRISCLNRITDDDGNVSVCSTFMGVVQVTSFDDPLSKEGGG